MINCFDAFLRQLFLSSVNLHPNDVFRRSILEKQLNGYLFHFQGDPGFAPLFRPKMKIMKTLNIIKEYQFLAKKSPKTGLKW